MNYENETFYLYRAPCQEGKLFEEVYRMVNEPDPKSNGCCQVLITSGTLEEINSVCEWGNRECRVIAQVKRGDRVVHHELVALQGNLHFSLKIYDSEDTRKERSRRDMQLVLHYMERYDHQAVLDEFIEFNELMGVLGVPEEAVEELAEGIYTNFKGYIDKSMPEEDADIFRNILNGHQDEDLTLTNRNLYSDEELQKLF